MYQTYPTFLKWISKDVPDWIGKSIFSEKCYTYNSEEELIVLKKT